MANHPNIKGRTGIPPPSPTPEKIREIRTAANLTQTEAAQLVYVTMRTWQKWEDATGGDSARVMPAAAWALFLIRVRQLCELPEGMVGFVEEVLEAMPNTRPL